MTNLADINSGMPLVLVGCGKMGRALFDGWVRAGLDPAAAIIIDPAMPGDTGAKTYANLADLPDGLTPLVTVIAVKPQIISQVLPHLSGLRTAALLSVAAGVRIATFASHLADGTPVVRAMPNTPAAVGEGVSTLVIPDAVDAKTAKLARDLMGAVGDVVTLMSEDQIDAGTAVSGSGPAYVFYLTEAMTEAGVNLGLGRDDAAKLARQTIIGAATLLKESDDDPAALRQSVTSPAGTTQAALDVLMDEDGLMRLMRRAIRAAPDRGRELGDGG